MNKSFERKLKGCTYVYIQMRGLEECIRKIISIENNLKKNCLPKLLFSWIHFQIKNFSYFSFAKKKNHFTVFPFSQLYGIFASATNPSNTNLNFSLQSVKNKDFS